MLITHDPETAFWADRVVHIRDGRLLTDEQEKEFVKQHATDPLWVGSALGAHAATAGTARCTGLACHSGRATRDRWRYEA